MLTARTFGCVCVSHSHHSISVCVKESRLQMKTRLILPHTLPAATSENTLQPGGETQLNEVKSLAVFNENICIVFFRGGVVGRT